MSVFVTHNMCAAGELTLPTSLHRTHAKLRHDSSAVLFGLPLPLICLLRLLLCVKGGGRNEFDIHPSLFLLSRGSFWR